MATALPNLRLDPETLTEIRQALTGGKTKRGQIDFSLNRQHPMLRRQACL
jgi:hypothetical protein